MARNKHCRLLSYERISGGYDGNILSPRVQNVKYWVGNRSAALNSRLQKRRMDRL